MCDDLEHEDDKPKAKRPKRPTHQTNTVKKRKKIKKPVKVEKEIPAPPLVRFEEVFQMGVAPTRHAYIIDEGATCSCGFDAIAEGVAGERMVQHAETCDKVTKDIDRLMFDRMREELIELFKSYPTDDVALIPPIRKMAMSEEYDAHVYILTHAVYDVAKALDSLGIDGLNTVFPATIGLDFCLYNERPFEISFLHTESPHADYCITNYEALFDDLEDELTYYCHNIDEVAYHIYEDAYHNHSGDLLAACKSWGVNVDDYAYRDIPKPEEYGDLTEYIIQYIMTHVRRCVYRAFYELVITYRDIGNRYFVVR